MEYDVDKGKSIQELVESCVKIAEKLINRWQPIIGDWIECRSVAYNALFEAARSYDSEKAKFVTYAYTKVNFALMDLNEEKGLRIGLSKRIRSINDIRAGNASGFELDKLHPKVYEDYDRNRMDKWWSDTRKYREGIHLRYRVWMYLRYVEEISTPEIARWFGVNKGFVSSATTESGKKFLKSCGVV